MDIDVLDAGEIVDECLGTYPQHTVGLRLRLAGAGRGYTLFAPLSSPTTYLVDHCGRLVHSWSGEYDPACSVYLLENGHLLRSVASAPPAAAHFDGGGAAGRLEELDWDGNLVWSYDYATGSHRSHHDVAPLPGGNILLIAWELKTDVEAVDAGRDPALLEDGNLWPDHVIEVQPQGTNGGDIVWEWRLWDHLVQDFDPLKSNFGDPGAHPELVDLNYTRHGRSDWTHANAVDYNAELDQIVLSILGFSELWVLDHSTTTAEAASHAGGLSGRGGDLLYRWGNPMTYRAGAAADQWFFGQHDVHWIAAGLQGAGHLLSYNNGVRRPGDDFSSIDEIAAPLNPDGSYAWLTGLAYDPPGTSWQYQAPNPTDFFGSNLSGAQRLENGNTLVCNGPNGTFFEVTTTGETVWRYVNPVARSGIVPQGMPIPTGPNGLTNRVFRAKRYEADHPGLQGRALSPGLPIEAGGGP